MLTSVSVRARSATMARYSWAKRGIEVGHHLPVVGFQSRRQLFDVLRPHCRRLMTCELVLCGSKPRDDSGGRSESAGCDRVREVRDLAPQFDQQFLVALGVAITGESVPSATRGSVHGSTARRARHEKGAT